MEGSELLSVLSALVLLTAYVLYFRRTSEGRVEPNAASWLLWVILIILNAVSYGLMTGDSVKAYLSFASSVAVVAVFLNALKHGSFKKLDRWDVTALLIGIVASFTWWWFHSGTYGNLLLQVALFISFFPTVHGVLEKPEREPPLPWFLWGIAFAGLFAVVILRWEGQPQDLVYPIQGCLWHILVGFLTLRNVGGEQRQ